MLDWRVVSGLAVALGGVAIGTYLVADAGRGSVLGVVMRAAYTGLILFAIGLLCFEIFAIWKPRPVTIGGFQLTADGRPDPTRADALRAMILQRYRSISGLLKDQADDARRIGKAAQPLPADGARQDLRNAAAFDEVPALDLTKNALPEIEMKIGGVNLGQVLTSLRRAIAPPNEMTGTVVLGASQDGHTAVVNWPSAPAKDARGADLRDYRVLTLDGLTDDVEVATGVACTLIWGALRVQAASEISNLTREQFCDWLSAFSVWHDLREMLPEEIGQSERARAQLTKALYRLERMVRDKVAYAPVYSTRAGLIALKPDQTPQDRLVAERMNLIATALQSGIPLAQARLEVADASSATSAPPRAESAIVERGDADTVAGGDTASEALDPDRAFRASLRAVEAATGYIAVGSSSPLTATAFVVAPGRVVTANYVGDMISAAARDARFSLAADALAKSATSYPVEAVLVNDNAAGYAVLAVPDLPPDTPTVPLANARAAAIGERIALVGFAASPLRGTAAQTGQRAAFNRLAVEGELTAVNFDLGPPYGELLQHDAPSASGMGGAPLVSQSGAVIGLHLLASDQAGRLGYAAPFDAAALAAFAGGAGR